MRDPNITEALLEMHYFKATVTLISHVFGHSVLQFIKPSPKREAWVGFDQAWVRSDYSTQDLLEMLRSALSAGSSAPSIIFGYFLQYKVVEPIIRKSRRTPHGFSIPYLRAELSLEPNYVTGISQHETLLRLSRLPNSCVAYACPMLFDFDYIYREADISSLRIVDILTARNGWNTGTKHAICFQDPTGAPEWCSDPIHGESIEFETWISRSAAFSSIEEITAFLEQIETALLNDIPDINKERIYYEQEQIIPQSFNLVMLGNRAERNGA